MVWLLIGIGVATAVVLLALVATLLRRLRSLSGSVVELQRSLVPVLEDIRRASEEAQRRMAGLEERGATLQAGGG